MRMCLGANVAPSHHHRLDALDKHQAADNGEKNDVGQLDNQIDLAQATQKSEQPDGQ